MCILTSAYFSLCVGKVLTPTVPVFYFHLNMNCTFIKNFLNKRTVCEIKIEICDLLEIGANIYTRLLYASNFSGI